MLQASYNFTTCNLRRSTYDSYVRAGLGHGSGVRGLRADCGETWRRRLAVAVVGGGAARLCVGVVVYASSRVGVRRDSAPRNPSHASITLPSRSTQITQQ
jgi:hypothetical protein